MKILYFLAHPNGIGGASNVLLKQAHLMQDYGHAVKIIIQDDENLKHSDTFDKVCNNFGLEYESCCYSIAVCMEDINILKSLDDMEAMRSIITFFDPDLIHSIQINTTVEMIAREMGVPHIMSVYPVSKGMFNIPWIDIFPRFHMADSEYYCRQWRDGLGIISKCIRVSYDEKRGAEVEYCKQTNNDKINIISIGVLTNNKNQLEILKFIKMCKEFNHNVHLLILGDARNEYGDLCKRFVEDNGLSDTVDFCGVVIGVEEYLKESDVLIHASRTESYPGVMVEAIANRIPVLITPVGGICEMMTNEMNSFFIYGFSAMDIYEAFTRFLRYRKTGKLQCVIEKAYKTYLDNHSERVVGLALSECYKFILANTNGLNGFKDTVSVIENTFKSYRDVAAKYDAYITNHIWFVHHINIQIKRFNHKTAKIWGAGEYGKIAYKLCQDFLNIQLIGVLDENKTGRICGYEIDKPTLEKIEEADILIVAICNISVCSEIGRFLDDLGKKRNKDYYFLANDPCMVI